MFGGLSFLVAGNMAVAASGQGGLLVPVESATSDALVAIINAGHPPPLWLKAGRDREEVICPPTRPAGLGSDPASTVIMLDRADGICFEAMASSTHVLRRVSSSGANAHLADQ